MTKSSSTPSKQDLFFVFEMLKSSLIDFSYINPWAEMLISEIDIPPSWLCDLALKKYQGDLNRILRDYLFDEPTESTPPDLDKFHLACLWLRYERRELSWATFLKLTGEYLDAENGDWDCEIPYQYLNVYEDAYFTMASEDATKKDYLAKHDFTPWIGIARAKLKPFLEKRRAKKHQ